MAKFRIIDAMDAGGKHVGFAVINLPEQFQEGDLFPPPLSSDSYFDTKEEAIQELVQRLDGKQPCLCGCGRYPKGPTSRFLPGHDLKKAYRDRPDAR